ncbi:Aste57867_1879 [Aphanomyces stellatus]|uniref:Aste57867_1879 protein n=1 Tax=Aphanomyces stellatus TaxID=120398 RepID=A0A485KBU9_9STRA|nr:hypothetical protein As57867_001877 [Aphanomyces stellatus]VFT79086.1 Aste57867_1879 [Aphanomyces stellatus]
MPPTLPLRAMGFCGADDSVNPKLMQIISKHYPWVEWGVLFRPDLEGTPRYATSAWVHQLAALAAASPMKLAAHLCGSRCQDVISGDWSFVAELAKLGFKRVQINATAANRVSVDSSKVNVYVDALIACMQQVPQIEWIIQANEETKLIWTPLVAAAPANMSILFDASCGLGVPMTDFPKPLANVPCGYAGGMGPSNIAAMLTRIGDVAGTHAVWVDMESSLRTTVRTADGKDTDIFSIDKCFACITSGVTSAGLPEVA